MKKKIVQWIAHRLKVNIIFLEEQEQPNIPHKYETKHSLVIRAEVNVDRLLVASCKSMEEIDLLKRKMLDEAFKTMTPELYKNCKLYQTRSGLNERFEVQLEVVKPIIKES